MKTKKVMMSLIAIFMSVAFMTTQAATPAKATTKAPATKECCKDSKTCTKKEGEKCSKETGKACDKKAEAKKPEAKKK